MRVRLEILTGIALLACCAAAPGRASQALADPDAAGATLQVNAAGEALVSYTRSNGAARHVLVWGAVNALPSTSGQPQVRFSFDYAGGFGKYRRPGYWKTFQNACRPYDGPALVDLVAGCDAPDGSYWALQSWQRVLPVLGFQPFLPSQGAYELHVSHWTGAPAQLAVGVHWTYGHSSVGLFGQLSYQGQPVYGFAATPPGNPRDRYSRNVYIDTLNSIYGAGWHRETGILLHHPGGTFCHSFVPQQPPPGYPARATVPAAPGDAYRVTVMGPGVTPVVAWQGDGLAPWNGSDDQQTVQAGAATLWSELMPGDARCAPEQG